MGTAGAADLYSMYAVLKRGALGIPPKNGASILASADSGWQSA